MSLLGGCREAAFAAALDFSKGPHIAEAARSLYLAEVLLTHDAPLPEEGRAVLAQSMQPCRYCLRLSISSLTARKYHGPAVTNKGDSALQSMMYLWRCVQDTAADGAG